MSDAPAARSFLSIVADSQQQLDEAFQQANTQYQELEEELGALFQEVREEAGAAASDRAVLEDKIRGMREQLMGYYRRVMPNAPEPQAA